MMSSIVSVIPTHDSSMLSFANEIKAWNKEDKTIKAIEENNTLYFKVIHGNTEMTLSRCDVIGVPKALSVEALKIFLSDTWVRLAPLENSYKLYIQPSLKGGGNIVKAPHKLWPSSIVPYEIAIDQYPIGSVQRGIILEALSIWNHAKTGFKFVPRFNEEDVLIFGDNPKKGYSPVGYQGGTQYIAGYSYQGQFDKGNMIREIGHAIGLYDEETRYDRDHHVVVSEKVSPAYFTKTSQTNLFEQYDPESIMHYRVDGDSQITFKAGVSTSQIVATVKSLSAGDIRAALHLSITRRSYELLQKSTYASSAPALTSQGIATDLNKAYLLSLASRAATNFVPEWKTIQKKADEDYAKGDYANALFGYQALIDEYGRRLSLNLTVAYSRSGKCYYYMADYYSAILHHWHALQSEPYNRHFHYNVGLCYEQLGDYEDAIESYEYVLTLRPKDIASHHRCGVCYSVSGNQKKALLHYQAALKYGPSNATLYNDCGTSYHLLKDYKMAHAFYKKALKIDPTELFIMQNHKRNKQMLKK